MLLYALCYHMPVCVYVQMYIHRYNKLQNYPRARVKLSLSINFKDCLHAVVQSHGVRLCCLYGWEEGQWFPDGSFN